MLAWRLSSHKAVYDALVSVTEQRLQEKALERLGQRADSHVSPTVSTIPIAER